MNYFFIYRRIEGFICALLQLTGYRGDGYGSLAAIQVYENYSFNMNFYKKNLKLEVLLILRLLHRRRGID